MLTKKQIHLTQTLLSWLPEGGSLPDVEWRRRHHAIMVLLWLHVVGLAIFAILAGYDAPHSLADAGLVAVGAIPAGAAHLSRRIRTASATLGLLMASAVLVHLTNGLTEAHFHFFVMLAVIAMYHDWLPFLLGIGFVVLEHGTMGLLVPHEVFDHQEAWDEPWKWALIHGVFVLGLCAAHIVQWRFAERTQAERRSATETQARLAAIVTSSEDGIMSCDLQGLITSWNTGAQHLYGYTRAEILGQPIACLLPPEADGFLFDVAERLKRGGTATQGESSSRRKDGSALAVSVSVSPIQDDNGVLIGYACIARDISERVRVEAALGESERALSTLMSNLPGMAYRWRNDANWTSEFTSEGCFELTGLHTQEIAAGAVLYRDLIHTDDRARVWENTATALEVGEPFTREYRLCLANGDEKWVWEQGRGVSAEDASFVALEGFILDITERKRTEEALGHQAHHDALTNLPNRVLLRERLERAIVQCDRTNDNLALLVLDLDRFKDVNDTLGHQYGDQLLQEVASRLEQTLAPSDTVARLGGDEFAVLLPGVDFEVAHQRAGALVAALSAPYSLQGYRIEAGASVGIVLSPEHGLDADALLRRADVAMYVAKQAGGGTALYSPEFDRHSPDRLVMVGELRHAIENDQLVLHYQPKFDCVSGAMVGVEALVRWLHPIRGLIPPDQFIPLAEQIGLIGALTGWVIEAALRQASIWRDAGTDIPVAINLSMRNVLDDTLPELMQEALARWGMPSSALELEITESSLMADPGKAMNVLTRLSDMGFHIAVDDFGTGYSSLSYLRQLPVHQLKVDRSFVRDMTREQRDRAIVESTVALAHNLGLRVVAEGVEDQETMDLLRSLGCDTAQGFHLGRPQPADTAGVWKAPRSRPDVLPDVLKAA
jgi:diguanylate cyclase (GGDEF)-like protein/PAS domain S-box-containing protein